MKRSSTVLLSDILKAIAYVEQFTAGMDLSDFEEAEMQQFAVIRNLEIICEAARQLDADFKKQHPEIPWKSINGMRNIPVHEYFGIDIHAVWYVIEKDLPRIKKEIKKIVSI